ncbi:uncharacterized protein NDAI_0C02210 [Naumovozyma dairenensis CBS 421]|uniref:PUA domain-containing protein n=1 Tax=Naumovozyma dairenensis (strain ATCC 10597 / BCRC 20456 / CBS 421 / NBRC 0211 / NRRL Y-12639) TaxID=1071378 RepID=G0W7X0_NAUDC|nr:hypothetical protein NDAI_0C02210 [Naumovozyma dairenensis CBS 421]CCD23881.1 hypothetical protein NDAI_0C02210 [Naumovozyma dairenensis CBS 421]
MSGFIAGSNDTTTASTATPLSPASTLETQSYTIVIKIGSSSLVDNVTREPKLSIMTKVVETVSCLKKLGHKVIIVSSGGIAIGLNSMNIINKPQVLSEIQALAAIGQGKLISMWEMLFRQYDQKVAQILLTRNDILNWNQFKNAQNTINALLNLNVVPIVNENDTLSISEIKFGDNDNLSAITSVLINADYLFLFTDVDCLYTENPNQLQSHLHSQHSSTSLASLSSWASRISLNDQSPASTSMFNSQMNLQKLTSPDLQNYNPNIENDTINGPTPILTVFNTKQKNISKLLKNCSTLNKSGSNIGSGGMTTKIMAAELATNVGIHTIIMNSIQPLNVLKIINYIELEFDTKKNFKDFNYKEELNNIIKLNIPLHTKFIANKKARNNKNLKRKKNKSTQNSYSYSYSYHDDIKDGNDELMESIDKNDYINKREFWILHGLISKGSIIIDNESYNDLISSTTKEYEGLLPKDIIDIEDNFHELECVEVKVGQKLPNGQLNYEIPLKLIGRARCNYTSLEINKIKGLKNSNQIEDILGYADSKFIANKENLALLPR